MNNKGSITVEASLVVPVVILSIIAVIYIAILLYQQAHLQSLADQAAERGAVMWCNRSKDMETGSLRKEDLDTENLYWRLLRTGESEKKSRIKSYLDYEFYSNPPSSTSESRIDRKSILKSQSKMNGKERVDVEFQDYIVYKKVVVTVEETYRLPIGNLLKDFGIPQGYTVRVRSEAAINEPVEFIRNTDFLLDTEKELERKFPGVGGSMGKIRGVVDQIKDKISELIKKTE